MLKEQGFMDSSSTKLIHYRYCQQKIDLYLYSAYCEMQVLASYCHIAPDLEGFVGQAMQYEKAERAFYYQNRHMWVKKIIEQRPLPSTEKILKVHAQWMELKDEIHKMHQSL